MVELLILCGPLAAPFEQNDTLLFVDGKRSVEREKAIQNVQTLEICIDPSEMHG